MKGAISVAISFIICFLLGLAAASLKPGAPVYPLREVERIERISIDLTGVKFSLNEPRLDLVSSGASVKVFYPEDSRPFAALATSRSNSVLYHEDFAIFAERMEDRSPRVLVTVVKFRR